MDAAVVDLGQVRGLALVRAKGVRIRHVAADVYAVPSASGNGGYVVDVAKNTCTCPAHEETGIRCKHLWAVSYHRHELAIPAVENTVSEAPRRLTYPQNWPAYNKAQCEEGVRVPILLRGLCDGITEEPHRGRGRPRIPLASAAGYRSVTVDMGSDGPRTSSRSPTASDGMEARPAA